MPSPTFLDLARSIDRQLHGNIQYPVKALVFADSPYTVSVDDDFINVDASGGNVIATLPDATLYPGIPFGFKKIDIGANTVTIQTTGGQTIDLAATKVLVALNDFVVVVSDGANWKVYAITISSSATGGAIFYQISKIVKTDGIATLVPVDGTLINFTVAVDGECSFWAAGVWTGFNGVGTGSLTFRIDGVDYAPESFFNSAGSGGINAAFSLSPHISLFLTSGPHTVELVASEGALALQASAGTPLTLSVLFPGASSTVAAPTPKAATLVVDPTPGIGDYTTIQNALDNLPAEGGYVLAREATYAENLVFPNKPVVLRGCGDGTVIDLGTSAGAAFSTSFNQILTIEDVRVLGDGAAAQIVLDIPATVNGTKKILLNRVNSYDSVKTIVRNSGATVPVMELKSSALRGWSVGWDSAGSGTLTLTDILGNFGTVTGATTGTLITRNTFLGTVAVRDFSSIEGSVRRDKTDTTTNAAVALFGPAVNARNVIIEGTVKNTGGVNTMTVTESVTDAFGVSDTKDTDIAPGDYLILLSEFAVGTARPPYVSYTVFVKSKVAGNHTNYEAHFGMQGVIY